MNTLILLFKNLVLVLIIILYSIKFWSYTILFNKTDKKQGLLNWLKWYRYAHEKSWNNEPKNTTGNNNILRLSVR